jgi:hypothetical protein
MSLADVSQIPTQGNGAAEKKKRKQRPMVSKFPCAMNFGITELMAQAVQRQCPPSSPFTQSDIGRLAVHTFLLQNDAIYQREIAADGAQNEARHAATR